MQKSLLTSSIICSALALTACGGDSNNSSSVQPSPAPSTGIATATQVVINATAGGSGAASNDPDNKYTYFNFSTGGIVELADDEAQASNAWDIAFKRNKIIVNKMTALSAVAAAQSDFYNTESKAIKDVFVNATAESEASHFVDVTASTISDIKYVADTSKPALGKDWYSYNTTTHKITANTDKFFLIENAESDNKNNVSIFNIKGITTAGRSAKSYTVQFFNNTAAFGEDYSFPATDSGTEFVATFTDSVSEICYDFDLVQGQDTQVGAVDCTSAKETWDLRFDASFNIWLNGGIYGKGSAKTTAADSFTNISAMKTVVPQALSSDSIGGTFTDSASTWGAYGVNGGHKIWSNYRVYAVKINDEQYKMRVLSYYAPSDSKDPAPGASGVVTFEYEKL